ncbi:TPA: hypothetical protein ACRR8F_000970 [Neisseria gonorrhoeae]
MPPKPAFGRHFVCRFKRIFRPGAIRVGISGCRRQGARCRLNG